MLLAPYLVVPDKDHLYSILLVLSRTRAGDKYLAIDILICALNGGFTVLAVKAFSSFLTQNFVDW